MEYSEEKQIEKMAADIRLNMQITPNPKEHPSHQMARLLVEDGYRKASEVAREIFEEMLEIMSDKYKSVTADCHFNMRYGHTDTPEGMRNLGKAEMLKYIGDKIAELKKKYTEEGK